jgi:hypothetical protein
MLSSGCASAIMTPQNMAYENERSTAEAPDHPPAGLSIIAKAIKGYARSTSDTNARI